MRLKISRGTVVTPRGGFIADVVCEDDRIAAIEESGCRTRVDEEIDAKGRLVFPGIIDPHVHSRDPGFTEKEDFAHATRAPAAGGVTTIFEMPNVLPPCTSAEILTERAKQHEQYAFVDFCLWGMCLGRENIGELTDMLATGAIGIKLFWSYGIRRETFELVYGLEHEHGAVLPPPTPGEVADICSAVARVGGLVAAHCEERSLLESSARALGRRIDTYDDLLESRPDVAEATAVAIAAEISRSTSCRFHVLHLATARAAAVVAHAQRDGIRISAETCPHYLLLTKEDYARLGARMKLFPPVRDQADRHGLWTAISTGVISSLSSDHAPHTIAEKSGPLNDQPGGGIGVETLVPLMLNEMAEGRFTAEQLSWLLSESTARLYGLYPRKGVIQPGSDADITIVDPHREWTIDEKRLHSKNRVSIWHGTRCIGAPVTTIVRGQVVMQDRELIGSPTGVFIPRATAEPKARSAPTP